MNKRDASSAITGVILAGGRSTRMGQDKALLKLPGGHTLLEQARRTLQAVGVGELLVSVRPGQAYGLPGTREITDATADCGPLGGLSACLAAAQADLILVLAVDLPAMTPEFLRALLASSTAACGAVPWHDRYFEPLAAVYPRLAAPSAHVALAAGKLSLQPWLCALAADGLIRPFQVEPSDSGNFINWNTPADRSQSP